MLWNLVSFQEKTLDDQEIPLDDYEIDDFEARFGAINPNRKWKTIPEYNKF